MGLTNTQYEQLMRIYSRRQNTAVRLQKEHREEVYSRIPEIRDLDEQITSLAVADAFARLDSRHDQAKELKIRRSQIRAEKCALLKQAGYPDDYLEIQYHCPVCKDTGYIDGKKCSCLRQAAIDLFYTQSGMQDVLEKENFAKFRLEYYDDQRIDTMTGRTPRENMKQILQECKKFVDCFDETGGNLLLYGGTGLGKTFLSHCIAGELLKKAHSCIYYSANTLFEALAKDTFSGHGLKASDPFTEYLYECDLLVIDDLGTELTNSFVSSQLFLILNQRIETGKSTIISTNLPLQALADAYSERVFSRITSSFTLLGLFGDDIRIKKKLETIHM